MCTDPTKKRCSKCQLIKSIQAFGMDRSRRGGLACWCKDCLNDNSRKYHLSNRSSVLARHREHHAANPPDRAKAVDRARAWAANNPDKARAHRKNIKHKRRALTAGQLTAAELRRWESEQDKVCHWCRSACDKYDIDHVVPLSRGGQHALHNLVIACPTCNRRKAARCPVEFAKSLGA